ncbi:MAG TPA: tetratricopeptide repeat protein, partial [Gemmataceae bacterium]
MNRVISWKRLAIVAGILLGMGAATFGIHVVQVRRQADIFKSRAYKIADEANGDSEKIGASIELLDTYLKFKPKDEEAFRRFAQLKRDRAKVEPQYTREAAEALDKYLRQFPEHPDERRQLIELYIDTAQLASARQHIRILFDSRDEFKHDVDLLDKAASCEFTLGDVAQAVKYLDDAIATKKAPPRIVERLLNMLLGMKAFNDPRYTPAKYIEILTNQEPYRNDIDARITAGLFLLRTGEMENARRHIAAALAMPGAATNSEALMAAAALERAVMRKAPETIPSQLKKARAYLEQAFAADKKNVRVGLRLSETLLDQGEIKAATDILRTTAEGLGPKNDDLTQQVVDRLLDLGELELSTSLIERIEKNEQDRRRIGRYFRGRIALIKRDWTVARSALEAIAPNLVRLPEFHKRAMAGIGQCYAVIQNPDKQLEHFAAALRDDPAFVPALLGQADAYVKLGKFREALAEYRVFVNAYQLESLRGVYAKLEFRAAAAHTGARRSWKAFEESLGPEEKRTSELQILYAESLIVRGDTETAGKILEAVLRKDAKNALAWLTLARITSRGVPGNASKVLEDAAKTVGDSVELRLARSLVLVNRTTKPVPEALRSLAANADKFEKADRRRLYLGLGEAASRSSHIVDKAVAGPMRDLAIEFFLHAAELDANDLVCRATLVDLGNAAGRTEIVDKALAEIAKVEGESGPIGTLAQAIRRLPQVKKIDDKAARAAGFAELRALGQRARASRPGWARVYVLLAQLDEFEGHDDSALAHYKDAIDRGERQEQVIRRAVELYRERRKDDDAVVLLNSLQGEINLPDDLERFRAIKDLLARDIPSTERPTIDRIAPADSKDWRILLLRGSLLAAIGADDDAQTAFRGGV